MSGTTSDADLFERIARRGAGMVAAPVVTPDAAPADDAEMFERIARRGMQALPAAAAQQAPPGATAQTVSAEVPQTGSAAPSPGNSTLAVAGNAALRGFTNAAGFPGTVVDGINDLSMAGFNAVRRGIGMEPVARPSYQTGSPLSGAAVSGALRDVGVLDRPGTAPEGAGQRYLAAGIEGAAGAPFGPAAVVAGFLSGMGGEAAADAVGQTSWGQGEGAQLAARAVGSLAGGVVGAAGLNTASRGVNAAIGRNGADVAAFDRLGVTPRMVADVTGSPTAARMTQAVSGIPGGTGRVAETARQTGDEFAGAVDRVAGGLGAAQTPQQAGEALQAGARAWVTDWRQQSDAAWNGFWGNLNPAVRSRLPETRQLLANSDTALRREAPGVASTLETDFMRGLSAEVAGTPNLSAEALRQLRTRIGDRLDRSTIAGGEDEAALKRLYGALTRDLESLASASGRPAVDAFREANRVTREGHDTLIGTVRGLIGTPNAVRSPEEAFQWFQAQARQGDSRMGGVRGAVGDAAFNEAAGAELRQLARPVPSAAGGGPAASPVSFNTRLNALSPEAARQLFRDVGGEVGDLATIAGRMAGTARLANGSQTAGTTAYQNALMTVPTMAMAGGAGGGPMGALAGAAAGVAAPFLPALGANLTARALTNSTVARVASAPGMFDLSAGGRAAVAAMSAPDGDDGVRVNPLLNRRLLADRLIRRSGAAAYP